MLKLLDHNKGDISKLCQLFNISEENIRNALATALSAYRTGNTSRPSFSPRLIELIEQAWMIASIECNSQKIRSAHLMAALFTEFGRRVFPGLTEACPELTKEKIFNALEKGLSGSIEESIASTDEPKKVISGESQEALSQFTENLTEKAKSGKIDPVFARDYEIKQMIDILSRRGKNNPILVGEPGTGKTAIVEGLALKVVEKEIPQIFADVDILVLDMGLLQAGASVKGEFENRLKNVIQGIRQYPKPVITFIDEAHTLIGAGGSAGQNDAANLLKPALARGELRTIAATTWSEYKKYFEKDPALTRRFQLVKIDEPDDDGAFTIMRGLRAKYENHHKIRITDEGIKAAVIMSRRYITGRQLPDKAIDVLDTASARVALSQNSTPYDIQLNHQKMAALKREEAALVRDQSLFTSQEEFLEKCQQIENAQNHLKDSLEKLTDKWTREREIVQTYLKEVEAFNEHIDDQKTDEQLNSISEQIQELKSVQKKQPLVFPEVNESVIASVLADWTGIPMGNMLSDEAEKLRQLYDDISKRIIGQEQALQTITSALQVSKTGMLDPNKPQGVFMLVGPSGVGKTETALSLANLFFGGEQYVVTINMSEYQEKHNVSRLIGSPPGYVGYGEGGVLTEAVRKKPYTVVLLDEVEKAHPDVMKLFYQVFDKGVLQDGEGRVINFKNTLIILTTNAASEKIQEIMEQIPENAEPVEDDVIDYIRLDIMKFFEQAFVARTTIIPYYPLSQEALRKIVHLKLQKVQERINHLGAILHYGQDVLNWLLDHCQAKDNGARNVDHVINTLLLPRISKKILAHMDDPEYFKRKALVLQIDDEKKLVFQIVDSNAVDQQDVSLEKTTDSIDHATTGIVAEESDKEDNG
ncbi:ClpV1 family type VI secretion ATPase [Candidatus Magnetomorum sp. HK-1]|nr:ClpV1 family type VI secretion ATPase [Candidatus Magnetomorum sp. HK-1]